MNFKYKKTYAILLLMACTLTNACKKNQISPLQTPVADQAKVAVVNAIPGAPAIDVLAGNTKISGNPIGFGFRFPSIQYSLLTPGNTVIKTVVNTPAVIPTPVVAPNIPYGTELSSNSFNFLSTKNYTLFLTGSPGGTTGGVVIEDVFPAAVSLKAHVKFVNVMPDGGNVDLFSGIVPTGATNPTTSTALFSNITRNVGTDYVAIDANDLGVVYQFQLKATTGGANLGATVNLTALPGRLYTVYARGFNVAYNIPGFTPVRTVAVGAGITLLSNR